MAFKIQWKPVLQALELKGYHPDFAGHTIMVCVNPNPELWKERTDLQNENARRYAEVALATEKKAPNAEKLAADYITWFDQTFVPRANEWFAKLWSFGEEKFTVQDLDEYNTVDPHFLGWLKQQSITMIEEHRIGRKKA